MRISELVSSPAMTVWSWRPISEAGRLLLRQGVTALCVVDADGRLLGIVSRSDLLRHRPPTARQAIEAHREDQQTATLEPRRVRVACHRYTPRSPRADQPARGPVAPRVACGVAPS